MTGGGRMGSWGRGAGLGLFAWACVFAIGLGPVGRLGWGGGGVVFRGAHVPRFAGLLGECGHGNDKKRQERADAQRAPKAVQRLRRQASFSIESRTRADVAARCGASESELRRAGRARDEAQPLSRDLPRRARGEERDFFQLSRDVESRHRALSRSVRFSDVQLNQRLHNTTYCCSRPTSGASSPSARCAPPTLATTARTAQSGTGSALPFIRWLPTST